MPFESTLQTFSRLDSSRGIPFILLLLVVFQLNWQLSLVFLCSLFHNFFLMFCDAPMFHESDTNGTPSCCTSSPMIPRFWCYEYVCGPVILLLLFIFAFPLSSPLPLWSAFISACRVMICLFLLWG